MFFIQVDAVAYRRILSYVFFSSGHKFKMKDYFKNKLDFTFTIKKKNTTEEFVREIQDHGGVEKVRVKIITSSCNWCN